LMIRTIFREYRSEAPRYVVFSSSLLPCPS
jgi:hypothetical protein